MLRKLQKNTYYIKLLEKITMVEIQSIFDVVNIERKTSEPEDRTKE